METVQDTTPCYMAELLLTGRKILVIGGGAVARRKIGGVLPCGARVTVIAPALEPELAHLVEAGEILHLAERFQPAHLEQEPRPALLFAATGDAALNREIARLAAARGMLCNSADDPGVSGFLVPAVVRRGPVTVGVSTSGASPALARLLKERIDAWLDPRWGRLAILFGAMRQEVHGQLPAAERPAFWRATALEAADAPDADAGWLRARLAAWGQGRG